jgi:hypothetical protein
MRGREFGLPSGQTVAKAMGVSQPLRDDQILIGEGADGQSNKNIVEVGGSVFAGNCPLWTYILAEALHNKQTPAPKAPTKEGKPITTLQLGPVGGRIVAEVFLQLLFSDPGSLLSVDPKWTPASGADYRLRDFVSAALAH